MAYRYVLNKGILSAVTFGVPQKRMRFVIMGMKSDSNLKINLPKGTFDDKTYMTVRDAIEDIENVPAVADVNSGNTGVALSPARKNISILGKELRGNSKMLYNHVSTETTETALARFKAIKQGENFHSLPQEQNGKLYAKNIPPENYRKLMKRTGVMFFVLGILILVILISH